MFKELRGTIKRKSNDSQTVIQLEIYRNSAFPGVFPKTFTWKIASWKRRGARENPLSVFSEHSRLIVGSCKFPAVESALRRGISGDLFESRCNPVVAPRRFLVRGGSRKVASLFRQPAKCRASPLAPVIIPIVTSNLDADDASQYSRVTNN